MDIFNETYSKIKRSLATEAIKKYNKDNISKVKGYRRSPFKEVRFFLKLKDHYYLNIEADNDIYSSSLKDDLYKINVNILKIMLGNDTSDEGLGIEKRIFIDIKESIEPDLLNSLLEIFSKEQGYKEDADIKDRLPPEILEKLKKCCEEACKKNEDYMEISSQFLNGATYEKEHGKPNIKHHTRWINKELEDEGEYNSSENAYEIEASFPFKGKDKMRYKVILVGSPCWTEWGEAMVQRSYAPWEVEPEYYNTKFRSCESDINKMYFKIVNVNSGAIRVVSKNKLLELAKESEYFDPEYFDEFFSSVESKCQDYSEELYPRDYD